MSPYSSNEPERKTWPNKLEYHLSLFSYILGITSFWRFPYLAYENKGAPFVYVFLLLHIFVGIPLIFLEMAWGQYGNLSPLQVFKTVPAMQGIGVSMMFLTCAVIVYFGVASYYFLVYLVSSFSHTLPWTTCDNNWNTIRCEGGIGDLCFQNNECNDTTNVTLTLTSPAMEYWANNLVYNDSVCSFYPNTTDVLFGSNSSNILVAPLVILGCCLGARLLTAMIAMANQVRFTGKVAYLLSTVPFAVLVMLLVRCLTLPGSYSGIIYLFVPQDLGSFLTPKVWKDACGQLFITIMTSWGGLITWSSYNRFYNKYHIDASVLIPIAPIFSLASASCVFGVAGYLSFTYGVPLDEAFQEAKGPFSPLVAYSEGLSKMWGGTLPWSIVVFTCLFLSSTSALFPCIECILSSLSDTFPIFRRLLLRNLALFFLVILSIGASFGVPCFLSSAGLKIIGFFDTFALPLCFMLVALVELLLLSYSFGFKLLYTNTKAMTGNSCLKTHFWTMMWGGISPVIVLACMVYTVFGILRDGIGSMEPYLPPGIRSAWGGIAGGVLIGFIFLVILLVALIKVCQSSGSCSAKFRSAFTPHLSRLSGNGGGNLSHTNGELFMSDYTSHRERGIEILVDEDIVTTV